jgi:hypothetical protein
MKKILHYLLPALALLCTCTSFAQTLINQSSISSFPYEITTPGYYKLTSNITVTNASATAFEIYAPNVVLDLGNYAISGPMSCTSSSCSSSQDTSGVDSVYSNVTVQNGSIKGFGYCVAVNPGSTVQNINASSCNVGIYANQATVRQNTVSSCAYMGIWTYESLITGNNLFQNGTYGIYADYSSTIANYIYQTTQTGLVAIQGLYSENTMLENGTDVLDSGAVSNKNNACTSGSC